MKCEICQKKVPKEKNSIVCSDKCNAVRKRIFEIGKKYFPTHGCDNCLEDLYSGCTEQCRKEFRGARLFAIDLWSIIHLIYPPKE